MSYEELNDEQLAVLHQKKEIDAFFILYNRYRNYGYVIVRKKLIKTPYFNTLFEEKDAILYDAIKETLKAFNIERGKFRNLFSSIVARETIKRLLIYQKDPLSNSLSLDANMSSESDLSYSDSLIFMDTSISPSELVNIEEIKEEMQRSYKGRSKEKMFKMLALKEAGYSFIEISKIFHCTPKAIRNAFYRIKKEMNNRQKKIKR